MGPERCGPGHPPALRTERRLKLKAPLAALLASLVILALALPPGRASAASGEGLGTDRITETKAIEIADRDPKAIEERLKNHGTTAPPGMESQRLGAVARRYLASRRVRDRARGRFGSARDAA